MVDQALIQRKLSLLQEKKKILQRYSLKKYEDFLKDPYPKAVEKLLQEMVEICLDIGKHLIADEGWELAKDNREVFERLYGEGVISKKVLALMLKMSGFRNLIVHLYEKIDSSIVYTIYRKHLKDFDEFARAVSRYIKK